MPSSWVTRPIFISSTFRDMQAERDCLRDFVFPELEERLRARRHFLEPIDLRLGVEGGDAADEAAREIRVLKVCLSEIQRSRPFLIVLLGDRYGWVPSRERAQAAAREAGFDIDVRDKSVTALEIEFGILKEDPEQRHRSFFYFREPLPYDTMGARAADYSEAHAGDPEARRRADRLAALKTKIRNDPELGPRVRSYRAEWSADGKVTGLEELRCLVLDDLWNELDAETAAFAAQEPPSWEEQERQALEEHVELTGRGFVGRSELLEKLLNLARSPAGDREHWGICVTGEPGSGKSAVFAQLHRTLAGDASMLLLSHAAGASPRGSSVDAMLRRWIGELAAVLGTRPELPETAPNEDVEKVFHEHLGRVSVQRRVVVLIDALNQFERTPRGTHVTWLPKLWPQNARLIATAIPGSESEAIDERWGIELEPLAPLAENEMRQIAAAVCARYRSPVRREVVDTLLAKQLPSGEPSSGNPLWLTLALEELNRLDEDDFVRLQRDTRGTTEERLTRLEQQTAAELPTDIEGLYAYLLTRTEELFGAPWAKGFASLIAVSRAGWRESDLRVLVPQVAGLFGPVDARRQWTDLELAALRRSFRGQLVRRGAQSQWDFAHEQMRASVMERNLGDAATARAVHAAISQHLLVLRRDDPLHESETMLHLVEADEPIRAARFYAGYLTDAEQAGATQALARAVLAGDAGTHGLVWVMSLLNQEGLAHHQTWAIADRFTFALSDAIENEAVLATRRAVLRAAEGALGRLVAQHPSHADLQRDLSVCCNRIGNVLVAEGDAAGALKAYRAALAIAERLVAQNPSNAHWQRDLSVSHASTGDLLEAQGDTAGALEAYRASHAIVELLVAQDPDNARWQRDLSVSHVRIGDVLLAQGDTAGALEAYRASHAMAEQIAAQDPNNAQWQHDLSVSDARIGDVLLVQGDTAGALEAYRARHAIAERLVARDPNNTKWQHALSGSHEKIGDVLEARGDTVGALEAYRAHHAIAERLAALDPSNTQWQRDLAASHCYLGMFLEDQGDQAGALEAYRAYESRIKRLAAQEPGNAVWQRDLSVCYREIGGVLQAQGDVAGTLAAYRAAAAIAERLAVGDPSNTQRQRDLSVCYESIGDVLLAQGDATGALAACRARQAIAERLAAQDPSNARWQCDLTASHDRIGDVLRAQGDVAGALAAYRAAQAIAERLAAQDPSNPEWQDYQSSSYERVGDVLREQGDAGRALAAYRTALAIAERLAAQDPSNPRWQRHLSVSHSGVGDVLFAQGDAAGALAAYRTVVAIAERLAVQGPSNAQWRRDLLVTHANIGDVLVGGDAAGALVAYSAALAIAERLAAEDPSNAGRQRDLAANRQRVGDVLEAQGDAAGALYRRT